MKRRTVLEIASGLVLLAAGFYAGGFYGVLRAQKVWGGQLDTEVLGGTGLRIDELAWLRSGDQERAIRLLEMQVDSAVLSFVANRRSRAIAWDALSKDDRRPLLLAKLYRQRYPPEHPIPALDRAMAWIPDEPIDWGSCRPRTRTLLDRSATQ